MIQESEIELLLKNKLPKISNELAVQKKESAYEIMKLLVAFICKNIETHNFILVHKAFKLAETLHKKGNKVVKNAVQNILVYSFTRIFILYPAEKKSIIAAMPITLYTLYLAQVEHCGC